MSIAGRKSGNFKHTIRITPEAYQAYKQSIAVNPPETFALLGGSLDDPMLITDFFFLPPKSDDRGLVVSGMYVYPCHHQLNYMIDNVLLRKKNYMLGLWHSHPGSMNMPSGPDLDYCSRIIANDDSDGLRWNHFLAPITTFNANGQDTVTAWVLPKNGNGFEQAGFAIEGAPEGRTSSNGLVQDLPALPSPEAQAELPVVAERQKPTLQSDLVRQIYDLASDVEILEPELAYMELHKVGSAVDRARGVVERATWHKSEGGLDHYLSAKLLENMK
ncbi:MAG: Mov34/MPN/PAD-1 family protein [Rhizobiales bacterium]|nr:Mov34/MPN/PAD-1 family protein [Hyphomicrobiales bacterium]